MADRYVAGRTSRSGMRLCSTSAADKAGKGGRQRRQTKEASVYQLQYRLGLSPWCGMESDGMP